LGIGSATAYTTGGMVIYNTATAVYADANNVVMAQGPVCRHAASSINGPVDAAKTGGATWFVADRTKPSATTQSGSQMQGKPDAQTPRRAKLEPPC